MNAKQTARANRLAGEVIIGWEDKQGIYHDVVDIDEESSIDLRIMPVISFCPCSNWEHAGWVWGMMVRRGYSIELSQLEDDVSHCTIFFDDTLFDGESSEGATPQAAIVACALAVFGYDVDAEVDG